MRGKIYLMLIGFAVFTGATFNLAKYSVSYFSPATAAGWRFGIAAIIMVSILGIQKKIKLGIIKENGKKYILLGILGIFGFNALFFLGMNHTSPLNAALIMGTNPVLTTVLAYLILKTSISGKQLLGIFLALSGVILVLSHGSWEIIRTLSFSIGDSFILLGNFCWALYGILSRKYLRNSSSMETTTYTMVVGAIALILLAVVIPQPQPLSNVSLSAWGAILFMSIFTTVLGYLWWNKGMEEIGASNTSIFFNLVPVVTMVISAVSGTPVTIIQVLGMLLVILGVLTSSGFINFRRVHKVSSQI